MKAIQSISDLFTQISLFYGFILLGYLISRMSRKGKILNKYLNSLLINLLLPILILYTFLTSASPSFVEVPLFLVIVLAIHLLGPVIIYFRLQRLDIDNQTKGSLFICSTFNNALFIPLPLVLIFIGPSAVPFVIMCSLTQMTIFVTLGSVMGAAFGGKDAGWKKIAKDATTFPPFLAIIVTLVLMGLNIRLPNDLALILSYNSPLTTYLALVSVGLGVGVRFSLWNIRTALNVIVVRQLIIPLVIIPIVLISTLSQVPIQVLILESLMPPAVLTVVYAAGFNLDVEIASTSVTVGTLLLLPLIPLILLILG